MEPERALSRFWEVRCGAEAVKALLPQWWLVHPAGPGEVAALARAPLPRTVVWLDELQRYLDGEHGLTGAAAALSPAGAGIGDSQGKPKRGNALVRGALTGQDVTIRVNSVAVR